MSMNSFPAFRLLLPFIAGIGLKIYGGVEIDFTILAITFIILLVSELKFISKKIKTTKLLQIRRLILPMAILLSGCFVATVHDIRNQKDFYVNKIKPSSFLHVRVD